MDATVLQLRTERNRKTVLLLRTERNGTERNGTERFQKSRNMPSPRRSTISYNSVQLRTLQCNYLQWNYFYILLHIQYNYKRRSKISYNYIYEQCTCQHNYIQCSYNYIQYCTLSILYHLDKSKQNISLLSAMVAVHSTDRGDKMFLIDGDWTTSSYWRSNQGNNR